MKATKLFLVILFSIAITSCGGGSSPPATSSGATLSGTAATGAAIANATITIKGANGVTVTTTTDATGKYPAKDVSNLTAPYLLKVTTAAGTNLYSVATASGTANIHPFTDLIIRNWYKVQGSDVETDFNGASPLVKVPTATEINTIEAVVSNILSGWISSVGLSTSSFNLITTSFNADSTGFDKVLDNNKVAIDVSGSVTVASTDPGGTQTTISTMSLSSDMSSTDTSATLNDFAGSWNGSIVWAVPGEGTNCTLALNLAVNGSQLDGTITGTNCTGGNMGTTPVPISGSVSNGNFSFSLPNSDPSNPDCVNFNVPITAILDSSKTVLTLNSSGTVCGPPPINGKPETMTGIALKQSVSLSSKFTIAPTTTNRSWDAAFDGTNYLVGIQTNTVTGNPSPVSAQLVSQSGALVGSPITVSRIPSNISGDTLTFHVGDPPFVSFDGTNYLMVWRDHTFDPTDSGIWGQFVSTGGALVGSAFKISSGDYTLNAHPIIFDGSNYFVAWNTGSSGDAIDIYGQFVSPSGQLLGSAIPVAADPYQQRDYAVGFDGTNILVVFVDGIRQNVLEPNPCGGDFTLPTDIYGQFISKSTVGTEGALSGAHFLINQNDYPSDNSPPTIAFDGTNYLVVWNDQKVLPDICVAGEPKESHPNVDLNGQLVGTDGTLSGGVIPISSAPGAQFFPYIAYDGTNYLVTWTDTRNDANNNFVCDSGEGSCVDIYGQFISKSGSLVGSEFPINADQGNQIQSFLVFAAGKYFVGWDSGGGANGTGDVEGMFISPYGS